MCFLTRFRPTPMQRRIWKSASPRKFGWRDMASSYLQQVKLEEGLIGRDDLVTAFDLIDALEGRSGN